jgi:hypothetical protein
MPLRPFLSVARLARLPAARRLDPARARQRAPALSEVCPLLLLLVVIAATWWAIGEHARYKSELRFAETRRYLTEFADQPVAGAWQRLSHAWQAELPRQEDLLGRVRTAGDDGLHAPFGAYREFVLATVEGYELADDVATVLRYFKRLALCVRMGSCDAEAVAAAFGDLPWSFRNQHYLYLRETYPEENLDRIFRLITGRSGPAPAARSEPAGWSAGIAEPGPNDG